MARGSYRQLHDFFHPELLQLKRQQMQQQQLLQYALEKLQDSIKIVELLHAKVFAGDRNCLVIKVSDICCR